MYPHHFRRPSSNEPYSRAVIRTKQVRSGSATLVSMMQTADLRHRDDGANGLNRSKVGRILVQRQVQSAPVVQEGHQKPIVSNPKKFGIGGIRGTDGQSGSTKNWRRTAKVFGDVGARTTSTQDRWSYRHGCSMKNVAGVWRSAAQQGSIARHCSV